jgi:hypothetical protein
VEVDETAERAFYEGWVPFLDGAEQDAAPMVLDAPTTHGPAQTALLADLTARFGAAQGVSTAATSPSLLDPAPSRNPRGDTQAGPMPADVRSPRGGY